MTFEQRFSEEEQVLISSLPTLIGTVMSFASGSGLGTVKELMSSARSVMEGTSRFPDNGIIAGVVPSITNKDEGIEKARELRKKLQDELKAHEVDSREDLRAYVIDSSKKVRTLLEAKASPEESQQFRTWILDIAENVAKAASEGGFFGFGGTQVSEGEKQLFNELASSLGINRQMN
jgi:hypothetical protein